MHKQLVLAEAKSSELNARAIADDSRMAQRKQKAKEKSIGYQGFNYQHV
jgi:hypothetical protein